MLSQFYMQEVLFMKLLIASDIHGSAYWCSRLCELV